MGAKCSKAPDSGELESSFQTATPPRFHKASNAGGDRKRMGFAGVANLETPPERQQGWGMKFISGAQEPEPKTSKLARAPSGKTTSVRYKTSTVAKKGALKVCLLFPESFGSLEISPVCEFSEVWSGQQVTEVLRGAGTVGLGALDTFSSSVANLNNRGFANGAQSKGNKVGILAFEVANTIVKGATLKMSLGEADIRALKEEILVSEGVHRLVSTDPEELLLIAAADKK
jgi:hypothetical protein